MSQIIQLNRDDLREIIVEYTRSKENISSNLLGELKQNQQELKEVMITHTLKIDSLAESSKKVEALTAKTNGRVTSLEKWRYTIVGGIMVLGTLSFYNLSTIAKLFAGQ